MKKIIFIGIILILACSNKGIDYYPLFQGSIRVYDVQRTIILGKDTTTQELKQVTKVIDKKPHDYWDEVWQVVTQETNLPAAVAYIRKTNSEIRLTQTLNDTTGEMKQLVLPLAIGNSWVVALSPTDTLIGTVLGLETIKVPVGEFDSCYKVEIKAANAPLNRKMWLAPNIGIVKNEIKSVFSEDKEKKIIIEKSVLSQYNTKPSND